MTTEKNAYLEKILASHKEKEKKSFLTISQLLTKFGKTGKTMFGLSDKSTAKDCETLLTPYLGSRLTFLKGSTSLYLAFKKPLEEIVLESFQEKIKKGPFSPGTVARNLPMKKGDFVAAFNILLENQQITVKVKDDYKVNVQSVSGSAAVTATVIPVQPSATSQPNDREQFQTAFEKLDQGRIYVRICNLRRELGWNEERFNLLLRKLRADGTIQLHAGDISTLTEEDVNLSYTDENNSFYATMTWKK